MLGIVLFLFVYFVSHSAIQPSLHLLDFFWLNFLLCMHTTEDIGAQSNTFIISQLSNLKLPLK